MRKRMAESEDIPAFVVLRQKQLTDEGLPLASDISPQLSELFLRNSR